MDNCELDYRSCGHCKVSFDGPFGHEARPSCDKASFFEMLFGDDWCPNAPMVEEYGEPENTMTSCKGGKSRNCDLFESPKNEAEEQKIWDEYHKWCNNPKNRDIDNFPTHSVVGWLLAPAEKRK